MTSYTRVLLNDVFRMYDDGYHSNTHFVTITMITTACNCNWIPARMKSSLLRNYERYTDKAINGTYGDGLWRIRDKAIRHGASIENIR